MSNSSAAGMVAVTGANGFIGAHCCLALLRQGFRVVAVVRDPADPAKTEFIKASAAAAAANLSFRRGDLLEAGSYDEAFAGCTHVLHTAAVVEIFDSKDPEGAIVRPSVQGTENVLAGIAANRATVQRYVHLSSCAAVQSLEKPDGHVFSEADWNTWSSIANGDPYGYAKARAERLAWDTCKQMGDLPMVALNPAIVIGPVLNKKHTKSSAVLVRQILYGNPTNNYFGTFVDVREVASAAVEACRRPAAVGKRFLVLDGEGPMNVLALNDHAKAAAPWVRGATPKYSGALLGLMWALGKLPVVGAAMGGLNQFQAAMFYRKIQFDNAASRDVLGVTYRTRQASCRDAIESMRPFLKGVQYPAAAAAGDAGRAESKQSGTSL